MSVLVQADGDLVDVLDAVVTVAEISGEINQREREVLEELRSRASNEPE